MRERLRKIFFIISIIVFIGSIGVVIWYLTTRHADEKRVDELKELIVDDTEGMADPKNVDIKKELRYYLIDGVVVQEKFKDIYLLNKDFVGWIELEDSKIDYPVMYTPKDIQYYLRRNFDKNYSVSGTIFIGEDTDVEKPSENVIIYGHHMDDGSMFANIMKYEDEKFYKNHKYIEYNSLTRNGKYEVIAAFRTQVKIDEEDPSFDIYNCINMDEEQFNECVKECISRTPYETNSKDVKYGDKLITLSTCAYHNYYGRYVVVAKLIEEETVDMTKPPIEVITTK